MELIVPVLDYLLALAVGTLHRWHLITTFILLITNQKTTATSGESVTSDDSDEPSVVSDESFASGVLTKNRTKAV